MRNSFADTFYELGKDDENLSIVVADISPAGSIARFREEFPNRFINTGVAEQIMIGLCAGMALRGLKPFAYTIATFALYRPFEMVRDDLGYQELPVTVVGIGGGVTYCTLGGTHHAMEDVAIASAIPGMSVLAPCDPTETALATKWCAQQEQGPVYLRLGKAGEPVLTDNAVDPFEFGKIRYLKKGHKYCVISYGTTVAKAVELSNYIEDTLGESASVVACHTIKPLDKEGIKSVLDDHDNVIVLEEHVPHGGLGSRVKELAWDMKAKCKLNTFSLKDKFIHTYGTHEELLDAHGFSVKKIIETILKK